MIEALKSEDLIEKVGGRFKLCTLIQRRLGELMDGDRPLIDRNGRTDLEVVIEEIRRGKITLMYADRKQLEAEAAARPSEPQRALL